MSTVVKNTHGPEKVGVEVVFTGPNAEADAAAYYEQIAADPPGAGSDPNSEGATPEGGESGDPPAEGAGDPPDAPKPNKDADKGGSKDPKSTKPGAKPKSKS